MVYNKEQKLKFLKKPYNLLAVRPKSPGMKILKSNIMRMNSSSMHRGDYIQSKYQFQQKIKDVVKTPEVYYYGEDIGMLKKRMLNLTEFVMKPNHLSRGIGVRVLKRDGDKFVDINGDVLTINDLVDECFIILKLKRYKGIKAMLLQERIMSHSNFHTYNGGMADIRMIYFDKEFLFCIARIPSENSKGYGNIIRGAGWGVVLNGSYVCDNRFQPTTITCGTLPYFSEMVEAGKKVVQLFGYKFQAVDMTVDQNGVPVVIESESMPQIEYYLTEQGMYWLTSELRTGISKYAHKIKTTGFIPKTARLSAYFPKKHK